MTDTHPPQGRETLIREASMPGRKWYWIAGLVGISGITGFTILLLSSLSGLGDDLQQMKAPGSAELMLHEPGTYTVFHEHESVFEGAYFSSPEAVSGLTVSVKPSGGGEAMTLRPSGVNASYDLYGRSGVSIFEFDIAEPGAYRVDARYDDGGTAPVVILAVGHDFTGGLITLIFSGLGIMFVGLGGAGAITIITYMNRERAALSALKEAP